MLECLFGLALYTLVAVIVVYFFEVIVTALFTPPPPVFLLVRVLVGILVLIHGLRCLTPYVGRFP